MESEELGRWLGEWPFVRVLCHADIHLANLLVADDDRILLVDWEDRCSRRATGTCCS